MHLLRARSQSNFCAQTGAGSAISSYHTRFAQRPLRVLDPLSLAKRKTLYLPSNGAKWTASSWLENSAQIDVDVPLEVAWSLWEDRTLIPNWMPWITSVVVLPEDTRMSRWTLSTYQFNRQWEFSWIAQNLTPLKNQKIHWKSVPGSLGGNLGVLEVANRGQIRFIKKSPTKCSVKLTISYEVPNVMAPFANLLTPVVEGVLQKDMERFHEYAKNRNI